ncbi:Gfo/Idh/MocA family oxidoreductase [Rhodohalobacter sulfatireducens]|uniref:Gfo/Idh/MocA family oxidoreductase n=1 Tax=Rhodohalobacter sulfatireducens TaxID=2911366 RepID=A0ABS9KJ18_9BACT|nr:Gfo/Idh/MocA family oxidoreductase [Rhodohalobacter sulfatireducens]MCG2590839.1 Gfo/Idh/MocA family oxidoreductase [Rhodohalobacter sulfatireducens]
MKNFGLTGLAGYIAPRHLKAIKDTGNKLIAAVDPHDSVGIIDNYFPNASFFTEFERFDRHLEKIRRQNGDNGIDYLSICSPNNLHDAHIRMALRVGADAICEKPLVLNPWNLDILQELEEEYNQRVWTILQLRVHPLIRQLKQRLEIDDTDKRNKVRLTYITSRGLWYHYSWKGNIEQSGGIGTNIGIHFFDLLMWLFGRPEKNELYIRQENRMGGFLELPNADVEWFLSLEPEDIPDNADESQRTFRSITLDGEEIEFSGGFTDLHTRVYEETLNGNGFGIEDARPSIELVHKLRTMKLTQKPTGQLHPSIKKQLSD